MLKVVAKRFGPYTHIFTGNGIQKAFYDDPNVLYISLHVHQNGKFYPPGPDGNETYCGKGPGLGK